MAYLLGAYPFMGADQTAQNAGMEHFWDQAECCLNCSDTYFFTINLVLQNYLV